MALYYCYCTILYCKYNTNTTRCEDAAILATAHLMGAEDWPAAVDTNDNDNNNNSSNYTSNSNNNNNNNDSNTNTNTSYT